MSSNVPPIPSHTNRYGGNPSSSSSSTAAAASIPSSSASSSHASSSSTRLSGGSSSGMSSVAQGKRPATGQQPGPVQRSNSNGSTTMAATTSAGNSSVNGTATAATPLVRRSALNAILVNTCQKGNPAIPHIRSVPWEYGDIKCDYQVGLTSGVLFLSLRYHLLHPEYIHTRIKKLGHDYALRIMLVHCDVDNHQVAIRELTKTCLVNEYTMMICWSSAEIARYLELYKQLERKPPDLIKQRTDNSYLAHLTQALTSVRGVNKTDVTTLASHFGTFSNIVAASAEALASLPGLGDKKVKRLRDAFEGTLIVGAKGKKQKKM